MSRYWLYDHIHYDTIQIEVDTATQLYLFPAPVDSGAIAPTP